MIRILLSLMFFSTIFLNAVEYVKIKPRRIDPAVKKCLLLMQTTIEKNYCLTKAPESINIKQIKNWLLDNDYNIAMEFLNDKNTYLSKKVVIADDDDDGDTTQTKKIFIAHLPNYKKIAKLLLKSAIKNNNALAANIYYSFVKSYLEFKDELEKTKQYQHIVKLMYADNQCDGYLAYGNLLVKHKKATQALNVYREGYNKCKNIQYYSMLFRTKTYRALAYKKSIFGKKIKK